MQEVIQRVIVPCTFRSLDKQVADFVDFVVSTESQCMVAKIPREVILKAIHILIQLVGTGRKLRTDIGCNLSFTVTACDIADLHARTCIFRIAEVADKRTRCTQLVVEVISQTGVQLGHYRIHLVVHAITAVAEVVSGGICSVHIFIRVVVLVAYGKFMLFADIPVHTCQKTERFLFDITFTVSFFYTGELLVLVGNQLGSGAGDVISGISRISA